MPPRTKTKTRIRTRTEARKLPGYCTSCGQAVKGEAARKAANPAAVFCCECGARLGQDGTCANPACPWVGHVPQCP
jgi:RNA polymerase-binding transcription factor DksA